MLFGSFDSIWLLHFPSICSPVRSAPTFGQTHTHSHTAHNYGWNEEEEEGGDGEDSEVGMKGGLCNCHGEYDGSTHF